METAPQLLHCGITSLRPSLVTGGLGDEKRRNRRRAFPSLSRTRRSGALAVATGPQPRNAVESLATSRAPLNGSTNGAASRFGNVSDEIKRVRAQMEEDEQLATLMRGLRGQNLSDSQFADENIRLRLVEVAAAESSESLPIVYDPDIISSYWGGRPRAVATRIIQLLSVAGGFLSNLALDLINKKIKERRQFKFQLESTSSVLLTVQLLQITQHLAVVLKGRRFKMSFDSTNPRIHVMTWASLTSHLAYRSLFLLGSRVAAINMAPKIIAFETGQEDFLLVR